MKPGSGLRSDNSEGHGAPGAAKWQLRSSYDLWWRSFVSQRFDVGNQLEKFLLANASLKGRHLSSVAGCDLFVGKKDRVADVAFVGRDDFASLLGNRFAENAFKRRRTHNGVAG